MVQRGAIHGAVRHRPGPAGAHSGQAGDLNRPGVSGLDPRCDRVPPPQLAQDGCLDHLWYVDCHICRSKQHSLVPGGGPPPSGIPRIYLEIKKVEH